MGKLSAALGLGGSDDEGDSSDISEPPMSASEPKPKGDSAELMAMKMFMKASSPEAKLAAFKAILEACGATGSDY